MFECECVFLGVFVCVGVFFFLGVWVGVWVGGGGGVCDGVTLIGSSLCGLSRLNAAPLKKAFVASGEPQMESLPFTLMAAFAELL